MDPGLQRQNVYERLHYDDIFGISRTDKIEDPFSLQQH